MIVAWTHFLDSREWLTPIWLSFDPHEVVYQLQSASRQSEYSHVIAQSAGDSLLQQVEMKRRAQGQPVPPCGVCVTGTGTCGALHCFSV